LIILDSAYKHGISDNDIRFAYENAVNSIILEEFPLRIMEFGFDTSGRALEIGYFVNDRNECVIMHAMKLRNSYHKYIKPRR
jgi:hypothetical protein